MCQVVVRVTGLAGHVVSKESVAFRYLLDQCGILGVCLSEACPEGFDLSLPVGEHHDDGGVGVHQEATICTLWTPVEVRTYMAAPVAPSVLK